MFRTVQNLKQKLRIAEASVIIYPRMRNTLYEFATAVLEAIHLEEDEHLAQCVRES